MTTTDTTRTAALDRASELVEQIAARAGVETTTDRDGRATIVLCDGLRVREVRTTTAWTGRDSAAPAVEVYEYVDYGTYGRSFVALREYRSVAAAVRYLTA